MATWPWARLNCVATRSAIFALPTGANVERIILFSTAELAILGTAQEVYDVREKEGGEQQVFSDREQGRMKRTEVEGRIVTGIGQ